MLWTPETTWLSVIRYQPNPEVSERDLMVLLADLQELGGVSPADSLGWYLDFAVDYRNYLIERKSEQNA